ncbi:membrane protein, putative [Marinomonas sp. MED121]|uniref:sulfite oxidase heme-binding subunit YedZ n=1 Tax=Marinomonas sp. MED121 TaxID=314277 RepID=UPI0000690FDB|nr:protein-methionine-sulfoxide reductase heme-binding subunit MsrQ [Marinomonas sp. MED121]EAQ67470.1 membrane protein, putative [Marinomonas sp. MED121]
MWDRKEKPYVLVVFCAPFIWLVYSLLSGRYFPDPAEPFMTLSGIWAGVFICMSLSITPLTKKLKALRVINRYRRFIGLAAFWYALVHLLAYLVLHAGFNVSWIQEDLLKRPYIYIGVLAFVILTALAITSPKAMVRKLGKRWKSLHKLSYLAGLAILAHLWWQIKADSEIALWFTPFLVIPLLLRINFKKIKINVKNTCTKSTSH